MALDPVPTYPGNYDANELNNSPAGTETRKEGDDHIRRMKASEKATWTNITGAVTTNHTELNILAGVDTSEKVVTLPVGAIMYFEAPVTPGSGWVKKTDAAYNDVSLRVVTGTPVTGGTLDFSTVFARSETDSYTLQEADVPSHNHGQHSHGAGNLRTRTTSVGGTGAANGPTDGVTGSPNAVIDGDTSNTTLDSFGGGGGHTHGNDMRVKYRDVYAAEFQGY